VAEDQEDKNAVSGLDSVQPLMLTVPQACKVIGCSRSGLFLLLREGRITGLYPGPRQLRIAMAECEAYVARLVAAAETAQRAS
jgi:excisionase family DNA binding protein